MNLQHEHEYQKKQGRNIVAGVDELEVDDGDVVDFFYWTEEEMNNLYIFEGLQEHEQQDKQDIFSFFVN